MSLDLSLSMEVYFQQHALKPCSNKRHNAMNDRLTELPDAILLVILSSFTTKEVARHGGVSPRLHYIWRCFYIFDFKDLKAMERIKHSWLKGIDFNPEERSDFATWVNRVLDKHLGPVIDEFKVAFDLNKTHQSHVDKWVTFALEKQVKILDLDFKSFQRASMNKELDLENHPLPSFTTLTSLRLKKVSVSDQFIDSLVRTCVSLENLCVIRSSLLINISIVSFSLQCLEVSHCYNLTSFNISAPKLRSFTHYGCPVELNVSHASSLSKVCIGDRNYNYSMSYVFESLVNYFSQLEHLTLMISLHGGEDSPVSGISNLPKALAKLKHLQLCVFGTIHQTLLGWTSFIGALPSLEMLTFKLYCRKVRPVRPIMKQDGTPLKSLKTLEICGFIGRAIDLEIATYVVENAIALEQVVIDYGTEFSAPSRYRKPFYQDESAPTRLVDLQTKLPPGVKLIVLPMESN